MTVAQTTEEIHFPPQVVTALAMLVLRDRNCRGRRRWAAYSDAKETLGRFELRPKAFAAVLDLYVKGVRL